MAGWIPGAAPMRYPEGSGGVVAPDELFVAQLHYHRVMEERFDQTRFAFHWQEQTPQRPAVMTLIGNARTAAEGLQPGPNDVQGTEFVIPVGQDAHTETSFHSLPLANRTARPFMVAPHMHLVGTGLSAWIQHADGTRDCLIDVPAYDYDWQLLYFLDPENAALEVSRDDEIVVECRYDNTTNNRPWMGALRDAGLDAPIEVRLGEGTLDEMCLLGVGAVVDP